MEGELANLPDEPNLMEGGENRVWGWGMVVGGCLPWVWEWMGVGGVDLAMPRVGEGSAEVRGGVRCVLTDGAGSAEDWRRLPRSDADAHVQSPELSTLPDEPNLMEGELAGLPDEPNLMIGGEQWRSIA
eukprot:2092704-Rhodomonas_salina.2